LLRLLLPQTVPDAPVPRDGSLTFFAPVDHDNAFSAVATLAMALSGAAENVASVDLTTRATSKQGLLFEAMETFVWVNLLSESPWIRRTVAAAAYFAPQNVIAVLIHAYANWSALVRAAPGRRARA
jgi:hypothetical protein